MKDFDYNELIDKLNLIEIRKEADEVATYYDGQEVSRKTVSNKYEIFDFKPFVIQCINEAMNNYPIKEYSLNIVGGRQQITLSSVPEVIGGEVFQRSFYLLNSSDKSRALSFSYGLRHNDFHFISKQGTIYKKHYTGITKYVEDRVNLDDAIFQDQLEILKTLIGDTIYMSNVQKIITESEILKESKVTLRNNFYRFCDILSRDQSISREEKRALKVSWLRPQSKDFVAETSYDFMVDSFLVFKTYLQMFNRRDSSEIRRESERIAKMGVVENRSSSIDQLLLDI